MANQITVEELHAQLESLIVVEVLPERSFAQGHLPGAINLPVETLAADARERLADRNAPIVVYCASVTCQSSHAAARALAELGYANVRVFAGGKAAWRDAGHLLTTAIPEGR